MPSAHRSGEADRLRPDVLQPETEGGGLTMLATNPPASTEPSPAFVSGGSRAWFNISAWSIRRPLPATLLFVLLMAVGVYAYMHMPITRYPNVDIPVVMVQLESPGT